MFLWCHDKHINPVKIRPERITWEDKKLVKSLDYDFLCEKKVLAGLKKETAFALMCFVMKTN